jgi:hypothetical protein
MTGRRVYCDDEGWFKLEPGDYVKLASGIFLCRPPDPRFQSGNLSGHSVVEHEDGTITVSPSILITEPNVGQWHGFLERGVWRVA